jgi:hypothetical protein
MAAQRALHGRWFAGKMITATYMVSFASVNLVFTCEFDDWSSLECYNYKWLLTWKICLAECTSIPNKVSREHIDQRGDCSGDSFLTGLEDSDSTTPTSHVWGSEYFAVSTPELEPKKRSTNVCRQPIKYISFR